MKAEDIKIKRSRVAAGQTELPAGLVQPAEVLSVEANRINSAFKTINRNKVCLSENASKFIDSLRKYYKRNKKLTERQQRVLFEISDSII